MQYALFYISLLIFGLYVILILYYGVSWRQIPGFYIDSPSIPKTRITVIIPARNEEKQIGPCLESVLQNNYPSHLLEILVVDDHSTDNTAAIVQTYTGVKCISLEDHISGPMNSYKKKAIETAILQSSGELIITTDADCIVKPRWLSTIAACYEKTASQLIVMPVCIHPKWNFLGIFQSLDFMTLQGITGASVYKGFLNMCNGANLAYTRMAFDEVDGFNGIDHIASGDDMLLMKKISDAFPGAIAYLKNEDVIVSTLAELYLSSFLQQRIRWASKSTHYDDKGIFRVLLLVYLFNLLMLVLPFMTMFLHSSFFIPHFSFSIFHLWLILLSLKILVELIFLYPVSSFFGLRSLLCWFPFMQPLHILYTVIAGFLGKFGKYSWKGRTVK